MKIAIVTDSNSGITQKQAQELGVFVLAMPFQIDGETYYEDITLTQEEFYKKLREPIPYPAIIGGDMANTVASGISAVAA